jgi:hypothetical protein
MTEKEIGKALLKLDTQVPLSAPPPQELARSVIARDRWRVRLLAGLATLFWVLTAAGVIWQIVFYFMYVVPRLRAYEAGRLQFQNDWSEWLLAGDLAAKLNLACIIALLSGAICTVLLILASRRATLRHINANLAEIGEQLKQLRLEQAAQSP